MPSKTIRHFEILEQIGQGGMGEVYRARDTQLKRTVAIKVLSVLNVTDDNSQRRFVQEARSRMVRKLEPSPVSANFGLERGVRA